MGYRPFDVTRLPFLGSANQQDHQQVTIPAVIHAVSGAAMDSKFEYARADAFTVPEIAQLHSVDSSLNPGAYLRALLLKPSSKVVGSVASDGSDDLDHHPDCSQMATVRQRAGCDLDKIYILGIARGRRQVELVCYSAWGLDADRRGNLLILNERPGSILHAD